MYINNLNIHIISMSLTFLENIPDAIVKNDLINYFENFDDFNYPHIFYKIGEGNIFYPECYLYTNKDEINLYGGYCENGIYNKVKYNIEEKMYIFYCEESILHSDYSKIGPIFKTKSWNEMYDFIINYFIYYVK